MAEQTGRTKRFLSWVKRKQPQEQGAAKDGDDADRYADTKAGLEKEIVDLKQAAMHQGTLYDSEINRMTETANRATVDNADVLTEMRDTASRLRTVNEDIATASVQRDKSNVLIISDLQDSATKNAALAALSVLHDESQMVLITDLEQRIRDLTQQNSDFAKSYEAIYQTSAKVADVSSKLLGDVYKEANIKTSEAHKVKDMATVLESQVDEKILEIKHLQDATNAFESDAANQHADFIKSAQEHVIWQESMSKIISDRVDYLRQLNEQLIEQRNHFAKANEQVFDTTIELANLGKRLLQLL